MLNCELVTDTNSEKLVTMLPKLDQYMSIASVLMIYCSLRLNKYPRRLKQMTWEPQAA